MFWFVASGASTASSSGRQHGEQWPFWAKPNGTDTHRQTNALHPSGVEAHFSWPRLCGCFADSAPRTAPIQTRASTSASWQRCRRMSAPETLEDVASFSSFKYLLAADGANLPSRLDGHCRGPQRDELPGQPHHHDVHDISRHHAHVHWLAGRQRRSKTSVPGLLRHIHCRQHRPRLGPNYGALLGLRCLQSAGSSSTVALCTAVVADLVTSAERGQYIGFTAVPAVLAPALGPVVGGLLSEFLGWRSIFWFLAIFCWDNNCCRHLLLPGDLPTHCGFPLPTGHVSIRVADTKKQSQNRRGGPRPWRGKTV